MIKLDHLVAHLSPLVAFTQHLHWPEKPSLDLVFAWLSPSVTPASSSFSPGLSTTQTALSL